MAIHRKTLTSNGISSSFTYGPEHQRTQQHRGDGSSIVYADGLEIDRPSGCSGNACATVKTAWPMGLGFEIDAPGTSAAASYYWTHTDIQGSVIGITDRNGVLQQSMSYDAWGLRRNLNGIGSPSLNPIDNTGYTGQEMLDPLQLVHMNGRIYDPLVARFISADPMLQAPGNSQSYNRYSYVWNRPTGKIDPSGFDGEDNSPQISPEDQIHNAEGWETVYVSSLYGSGPNSTYASSSSGNATNLVTPAASSGTTAGTDPDAVTGSSGNGNGDGTANAAAPGETNGGPPSDPIAQVVVTGPSSGPRMLGGGSGPYELVGNGPYQTWTYGPDGVPTGTTYHANRRAAVGAGLISLVPVAGGLYGIADSAAEGNWKMAGFYAMTTGLDLYTIDGGGALRAAKTAGQLGREGEAAVRAVYDIGDKAKIVVNGRTRIPDGINEAARTVSEVKNVDKLSLTSQLRDYSDYAQSRGFQFNLYTRPSTTLSGPLQNAVDSGLINRLPIP